MRRPIPVHIRRNHAAIATAVAAALSAAPAFGDITPGGGVTGPVEYTISATGATALGALTRGANTNSQNFPTGEQNGLWRLGTNNLQIGRSTYTFNSTAPLQLISFRDQGTVVNGEIVNGENVRNHDHIVYEYHETGSVNGVLETVKSGGLFIPFGLVNPGNPNLGYNKQAPATPSQGAPLWRNGFSQIDANNIVVNGSGTTASSAGGRPASAQPLARIGYSDVRSFQAFSVTSPDANVAPSPHRRPRDVAGGVNDTFGYGKAFQAYNAQTGTAGTNFQKLADRGVIDGENTGNPNDSRLRNETLAIVPFGTVANPGTGLTHVKEGEVKFLNATGRLPNGANFNTVTREIGSGTRNQGTNNVNLDASWGGGERDRRSLATGDIADVDVDGVAVTIRPGDEMNPNKDLFGVSSSLPASEQPKEHRVGPLMRFSDKNSGGSGVRPTVVNNRMAVGANISTGDIGERGIAGTALSRTDAIRVLGIGWDEQAGEVNGAANPHAGVNAEWVQPTAIDVTTGRYQQYSEAQAVTVIGVDTNADGTSDGFGTVGTDTNPNKPIHNDEIDHAGSTGTHRKFINNITGSLSTFGVANQGNITPADAVVAASFVPQQIMKVTKQFDGGIQTTKSALGNTTDPNSPNYDPDEDGLSNFDPDGSGSALSTDALYDRLVVDTVSGNLKARLNWADPATINGNIDAGQAENRYKIFAVDLSPTATVGTKEIAIKARTVLAGDMNNDTVRDLGDVEDLARAYVASEAAGPYAKGATPTEASTVNITYGTQTLNADDLLVLTDFDGSGNITGNNAAATFKAIDRQDVKAFLTGAMVDTGGRSLANSAYRYTDDFGNVINSPTAAQRREDGVRLGQLRKNEAIVRFNTAVNDLGASASLKFSRFDVNGDGVVNRTDARIVDGSVGADIRSLDDSLAAIGAGVDLVATELTDDNVITHVDPNPAATFSETVADLADLQSDSDFQQIRKYLGDANLLDGDTNFDGSVEFGDLGILLGNFNEAGKWSDGDSDFNGTVEFGDLGLLLANFNETAGGSGFVINAVEYGLDAQSIALLEDSGFTVVPEPASAVVLACGAFAALGVRRRGRRSGR